MLLPSKAVSKIYWCTQLYIEKKLGEHGIGIGEASILMTLKRKSMSQKEIAENVKREEEDRRRHVIYLTDKGRGILPEIWNLWREWRGILFLGFASYEKTFIIKALKKMEQNAIKAMEAGK